MSVAPLLAALGLEHHDVLVHTDAVAHSFAYHHMLADYPQTISVNMKRRRQSELKVFRRSLAAVNRFPAAFASRPFRMNGTQYHTKSLDGDNERSRIDTLARHSLHTTSLNCRGSAEIKRVRQSQNSLSLFSGF